jgi:hypothetical protein
VRDELARIEPDDVLHREVAAPIVRDQLEQLDAIQRPAMGCRHHPELFRALGQSHIQPPLALPDPLQEKLESISLKPSKANITIKLVALAWTPHWRSAAGAMTPAWD